MNKQMQSKQKRKINKDRVDVVKSIKEDPHKVNGIMMKHVLPDNLCDFNAKKEHMLMYDFKTSACLNIAERLFRLVTQLDRTASLFMLLDYVDPYIAENIELGILEFTLIKVTSENLPDDFLQNIYSNKLRDIILNINPDHPRIQNKTLRQMLINGYIDPHYVSFMSPSQMHPIRWKDIIDKKTVIDNASNNIAVTDLYKCPKCGNRKAKTSQMQLRSADEPMTIFITCIVCYHTITE